MAEADLLPLVRVLERWRRFLIACVGGAALVSVVVSFFLPKWYTARSTMIPPQSSDIGTSLSALVQGLSIPGIGNVAPTSAETELYLAILDSRTLREKLIKKFDLVQVYRSRTMDDAVRTQRQLARAGLTDQGIVEVSVEDRSPQRAAEMANAWMALLDDFNKNARMTGGKRNRLFVEQRLEETRQALEQSEQALADYQKLHKSAPLSTDVSAAVESGAGLLAQRMALQVKVNLMSDLYRESSPQVTQARAELAALDRQIDQLPPLAMEFARLLRNVKVQEQVFALLTAQYEEAKIREVKDTPTLDVLDAAVPPQRRSRPIRWLFCASITGAAAVLAFGLVFGVEYLRQLKSSNA